MNYQVIPSPRHLRRLVQFFWMYQESSHGEPASTFRIFPDGRPGIIVNCCPGNSVHHDAHGVRLPDAFIYGQSTRYLNNYSRGHIQTFGVCLSPLALPAILASPAAEITDSQVDFSLVNSALVEQVILSPTFKNRVEIMSEYLSRCAYLREPKADLTALVANILREYGSLAVRQEYRLFHLSERQLVRKFESHVGVTPKAFARIARFQAALDRLRYGSYSRLSDVAFDLNYSDQSHFVREFRQFSGLTPKEYASGCHEVIQNYPKIV